MRSLEVLDPGRYALVEDLGRPGYAHLGVAPSGALDTASLRLANRLAGNPATAAGIEALLDDADLTHPPAGEPREVTLDVRYDGEDLALVASDAGMSADAVVELHTEAVYTVAFTGFAPGFGYLTGLPSQLRQPRLESPRTRVPAGSVGLAGEFTGVYPRESPGGWRLLGHTSATLFDPHADPPGLFAPGDRVRFRSVR